MHKSLDIFYQIPCLTESSTKLSGTAIQKKWFRAADKRIMGQYLQKFVSYNQTSFDFLGVNPFLVGNDQHVEIGFQSSHYIGAIPLRSSDTGKQIGDFMVVPRFMGKNMFEEYVDIINLLGSDIQIDFLNSLPLASGKNFRPPLYLEAVKFIHALEKLVKIPWRKFTNKEIVKDEPLGQVNWNKYIKNEYKVENKLKYPVTQNLLTELHYEYAQIRYVFDICAESLSANTTPIKIKSGVRSKLDFISSKMKFHKPLKTSEIQTHHSDNQLIKECKAIANRVLKHQLVDSIAWRVDFNEVFEKFVQHIFKEYAKESGSQLFTNFKFRSNKSNSFSWELKQLEPDAILKKDTIDVFIDAKYKAHLFNKYDQSEKLKEEHRRDLHQILAYNSFSTSLVKYGFLCYPANDVECKYINYHNSLNNTQNKIFILGIPLSKSVIPRVKEVLIKELNQIFGHVQSI
ncbi:hypothetical protein [Sphingobacterium kitahiroshimense]|uniref:hypothetical protein n=1 Tax=Sphingobacterium kitahiroshimense TaxID=470446 RepID=UPI003208D4BD